MASSWSAVTKKLLTGAHLYTLSLLEVRISSSGDAFASRMSVCVCLCVETYQRGHLAFDAWSGAFLAAALLSDTLVI